MISVISSLFISFLYPEKGQAQARKENTGTNVAHHVGILFTGSILSNREDLLVPLGFSGPEISLGGHYTGQTSTDNIDVRFKVGVGYLKNRYSHETFTFTLELRPRWIREIAEYYRFGIIRGGLCFPMKNFHHIDHSWDDAHLYWLSSYSVGIAGEMEKKIGKANIGLLRLEVPLMSLISRPPKYRYNKQDATSSIRFHFTEPNRSFHLEMLDDYRALFFQALIRHNIDRSRLNAGFEFSYDFCRIPEKVWILNTSIFLSYQWGIGQ